MKVGWIGLGRMGEAFALAALAKGHDLIAHSRGGRPRPALTAAGGRITDTLENAVADAEVVGVGLFDDAQVRAVLIDSGVMGAMRPGSVLALHTTGAPQVVEALAAAAPAGVTVLDATFSGVQENARNGDIRLFVGGDAAALDYARPVLSAYCSPILHLGAVGAARRLKLINNLLFAAQVALAAEALGAVQALGLSLETSIQGLSLSSGGSFALNTFLGADMDARLTGLAHYLDKDVDAARAAARAEGLTLPLLEAAAARWGKP